MDWSKVLWAPVVGRKEVFDSPKYRRFRSIVLWPSLTPLAIYLTIYTFFIRDLPIWTVGVCAIIFACLVTAQILYYRKVKKEIV